ncbi:type II secretion system F family protein [Clostridium sp. NSJ-6]|uniref:Type II secretion system F family protein n=1 Tax=Clostridium hominis TaxID=2763036 RepID=A0ABR7DH82_9CLOT|nr:type II secretion system F family protein [Clostridium hominis]MBC5630796.1 type II secretion system F family protein [Clostridium hominis]MDU2673638.1 type II secretion system F family protein [Clostridium sp.]
MAKFKYRAMSGNGKKIEGNHVANSRDEVIQMITSNGYYPLMIEEVVESTNIELGFGEKVTTKDIAIFCRQLYTMIDAGVSINRSLNIMANQLTNKKLRKVTVQIEEDVKKGEMLSAAIKKHDDVFPQLLISMVESGEISGNLDTMMLRMSTHFEKENKLNNKIKTAMTYPTVLGIVAVCAVMFIMTFVMPTFIEMFESEGVVLPLSTQILINLSSILQKNILFIIVIIICFFVAFKFYSRTNHGIYTISKLKLHLPIIGELNKKIIVSRFTRTLSTLIASGVSLVHSLPVVAGVLENKIAEDAINKVREEVTKGEGLSEPIKEAGIFPEMLSSMINIGEETGQLDEILNKTADFYDDEVEQAIQTTTALIEPLLIVVMGLVIGFIVISIMLPMFDMYTQM